MEKVKPYYFAEFQLLAFVVVFILAISCKHEIPIASEASAGSIDCHENPIDSTVAYDSVNVLIAGAINVSNNKWNACFWKNDSMQVLESNHSIANDILTADDKIIIGGEYEDKPCFWINGNLEILDHLHDGKVKAVGYHQGKIYMVGQIYEDGSYPRPFIWKDGKVSYLSQGRGYASDIAFSGKDIYVSGMDSDKACYWKNGVKVELSETLGHGYAIEVRGADVYVGGEYRPTNGGYFIAGYWKNGKFVSPQGNSVYVWNLGINGGQIVLVGNQVLFGNSVVENAICIRGNDKANLKTEENVSSGAIDITFNGKDEYVLGTNNRTAGSKQVSHPCYWVNDKLHDIPSPLTAIASAIFLEPAL
ncbi:hypothetical protein [Dyadobacter sp. Leaf189]|uniref:hypothetical protein n=1 Tax=Dyadobacter sp. Leaf189 TaxID=1736295 RepID=UPI0006FBE31E|nr:hypothetical protein [Dyadobacter sp. Leaf189]KQS33542.1 hypothetical protein ASG33_05595 [Dyadobacter sp. Leaf189]